MQSTPWEWNNDLAEGNNASLGWFRSSSQVLTPVARMPEQLSQLVARRRC